MGILKPRDVCGFLGGGSTSEEGYNYTGERERERERERENSNLKTLFYKDCSLGSVKNLSNN